MPVNKVLIETKDLVKTYEDGRILALRDVNIKVMEGGFIAIMGPSGSGKSTLLNMLGGLDYPTSGEVIIDGVELPRLENLDRFRAQKVGFIFQLHNLMPTLTSLENVQIPMFPMEFPRKKRLERAKYLLKIVGLEKRMYNLPTQLSGGERQRVAIARALANDPSIILADEPTGNLDSASSDEIIHLLLKLNREGKKTIILVTHDQEIANHAQSILHIKDGKILNS